MKIKIYNAHVSKVILSFFLLTAFILSSAQTTPDITRLIQQNTVKGSRISLVETTDTFTYHIGTMNSSEVGFDNLTASNVGFDDLFILKSNSNNGGNSWFKTFNAGVSGIITPRYIYVDRSENIYVFGQFKGSITVNAKTISSVNQNDGFLMKVNSSGNAVWINYLENAYESTAKVKCIADGDDVFFVYGGTHLLRMANSDGSIIYNNVYNDLELKSVELKSPNMYIAGSVKNASFFGTESFSQNNIGFILKGDKNANFTSSLKTSPSTSGLAFSDVSDIAISGDGFLLLTGFYTNKPINIQTENVSVAFSFNPNNNYENINRLYNYVAKVDLNLETVSFSRTSTAINREGTYNIRTDINSSKIIPVDNSGNFRQLTYISDRYNNITSYTNANGTLTTLSPSVGVSGAQVYTNLLSYNSLGGYTEGGQVVKYNDKMSASGTGYTITEANFRLFTVSRYNASSSILSWSKQKNSSLGGSLSQTTVKHLRSSASDFFLTTLVEGQVNFFGRSIINGNRSYSRYVTRVGADGISKWMARIDASILAEYPKYNVSQNFTAVDSQDNIFLLLSLDPTGIPRLTDASGSVVSFSQNVNNDWRVLIKLDKDGKYLWSKEISGSEIAGISLDKNDNLYVVGTAKNLMVSGLSYNNSNIGGYYFLKFGNTGNLTYSKFYQNNSGAYSVNSELDNLGNLYLFSEPINYGGNDYIFGNITIPSNEYNTDLIMVKLDAYGNVVMGKNFYNNSQDFGYAWPNDVKFDGNDLVLMGNYYVINNSTSFIGLDLTQIPRTYINNSAYVPFIAKISTTGNVIWQKSIDSNNVNTGNYTNIEVDENKNIYMFYYVKDKVSLNGLEYSFDSVKGNKVLLKLNTNGGLSYVKTIDYGASSFPMVDVIANDKLNISAFTLENSVLNYPIKNANASNLYIATLGALDQKYLTPKKDDRLLTLAAISNDPQNPNRFDFDLVSNFNWTANSDQPWLTISSLKLGAKNMQNTLSGYGDAALTALAAANNTGADRSANILISGDGTVAGKTVIVTQSGILGAAEASLKVIVLYPNPTSEILHVKTDETINKIEIFDVSGRILKTVSGKTKAVRVADMEKGLYLIKIHTASNIINSKFIKN